MSKNNAKNYYYSHNNAIEKLTPAVLSSGNLSDIYIRSNVYLSDLSVYLYLPFLLAPTENRYQPNETWWKQALKSEKKDY